MRRTLNLVYLVALACYAPILWWRATFVGKKRPHFADQLFGRGLASAKQIGSPAPNQKTVWFHAVSVGEVALLKPLIDRIRSTRPNWRVVVSSSTDSGLKLARERFRELTVGPAPLDFTWSVARTFADVEPDLLALVELELWPNLLFEAKRRGTPVVVINARLGEKSASGYRRAPRWIKSAFASVRYWGAQSDVYAERVRSAIDPAAETTVTGSIKYDGALRVASNAIAEFADRFGIKPGDRLMLAGSTQYPEETYVLDAWSTLRRRFPDLRLLIAARHPERFDAVAELLERREVRFVRRSLVDRSTEPTEPTDASALTAEVILLDTIGELAAAWGSATFGFVGGSFDGKRGGQSMIEPAALGVPVCFGPHIWNFADTVDRLLERAGAVKLDDPSQLTPCFERWLDQPDEARAMGERAKAFIQSQQGAVERTIELLDRALGSPSSGSSIERIDALDRRDVNPNSVAA